MVILLQKNSKQFKQLFHKKWGSRSVIPQSIPGTFILLTVHKTNQKLPNSAVSPLREVLHHLARCRRPAWQELLPWALERRCGGRRRVCSRMGVRDVYKPNMVSEPGNSCSQGASSLSLRTSLTEVFTQTE